MERFRVAANISCQFEISAADERAAIARIEDLLNGDSIDFQYVCCTRWDIDEWEVTRVRDEGYET